MKKILPQLFFFGIILSTYSQVTNFEQSVLDLQQKINITENGEKLKLLDSLTKITRYNSKFKYDSIAKQTIRYAIELDSIELAVQQASDLIFYYANRANNAKEGIKVYNDFEKLDLPINDNRLLSKYYTNAGDSYFFSGKMLESIPIYEKAEQYALLNNDSIQYATAKTYKSAAYQNTGDYVTASKLLLESSQVFQNAKDTSKILMARVDLATLYSKIGFFEESKKVREEIIEIARKKHIHKTLVPNLYNGSIEQEMMGNEEIRIAYLKEAYEHVSEPDYNLGTAPIIHYALLSAYSENDSLVKATKFYTIIQKEYAILNPIPYEDNYRSALVDYYMAIGDYKKALIEAKWTLNKRKSTKAVRGIYIIEEKLAKIYELLGDTNNSYQHYKNYVKIKDSVTSIQKTKALTYYQTLYETKKRDSTIKIQESEIALLDTKNKIQFLWIILIVIGLIAALIIFSINYKKNKQNIEIAKNKKSLLELKNEILSNEIKYKKKDLNDFAFNISQNQKWAKVLLEKFENFKESENDKEKNLKELEDEIKNKIWVDNNTNDFNDRIEKLSSEFYKKLSDAFPKLTKTEIRLCSLIRMKIASKEIAILQNINPESVKKSRYRLRKKINLNPEQDLDQFLQNF